LLVLSAPAEDSEHFFFRDGDRVVMVGDSITEQHLYSNYVETWTVTRFPSWQIVFRNAGIGGDRSPGGNSRFKRDVLSFKPTALTVDFGMNDGNYRPFAPKTFQTYMDGLDGIASQAEAAHIRVAWLTPSPVEKREDGPAREGYNETLEKFAEGVKEVASRHGGLFVDQLHPFLELEEKARAADPKNRIGGGDAVHPGAPGQAIMAWSILKGLHFPALVSSAEIDADSRKVIRTERCKLSDLRAEGGRIRFERLDQALPFFPRSAESILKWAPIRDELNQYRLRITGIKQGRYEVRIDGDKIAAATADELGEGVNLAAGILSTGPIAEQSRAVAKAVDAKNRYFHDDVFRGVMLAQVALPDFLETHLTPADIEAKRRAAIGKRLERMPEFEEAIRRALVLRPHNFEIVPLEKE
jgi:lysophospholipase L1-like esterase